MTRILKTLLLVGALISGLLLQPSCTSKTMFRPLPDVAKILRGHTWNRVFYNDTSTINYSQTFAFEYTDLVVNSKFDNGKLTTDTMRFSFNVINLQTYVKIEKKEKKIDPFFKGEWEILKLEKTQIPGLGRKYILQLVRDGAVSDNNPITVEGGLNMMEFVAD